MRLPDTPTLENQAIAMTSKTTTQKHRKGARGEPSHAAKPSSGPATKVKEDAAKKKSVKDVAKIEVKKFDASTGPTPEFPNAREFAKAIAKERNLVEVGSALLGKEETKGASVRARMFETTLEYLYGKPAAAASPDSLPVRVVWDIPMSPPDDPPE